MADYTSIHTGLQVDEGVSISLALASVPGYDGEITLFNDRYLKGYPGFGASRNLIGMNSSDTIVIGENAFSVEMGGLTVAFTATCGSVIATDKFNITAPTVPPTAASTGNTGEIAWDSGFIYVCLSPFVWVRAPLATWP
jgi:hypothetical protein